MRLLNALPFITLVYVSLQFPMMDVFMRTTSTESFIALIPEDIRQHKSVPKPFRTLLACPSDAAVPIWTRKISEPIFLCRLVQQSCCDRIRVYTLQYSGYGTHECICDALLMDRQSKETTICLFLEE